MPQNLKMNQIKKRFTQTQINKKIRIKEKNV